MSEKRACKNSKQSPFAVVIEADYPDHKGTLKIGRYCSPQDDDVYLLMTWGDAAVTEAVTDQWPLKLSGGYVVCQRKKKVSELLAYAESRYCVGCHEWRIV